MLKLNKVLVVDFATYFITKKRNQSGVHCTFINRNFLTVVRLGKQTGEIKTEKQKL